MEHGSVGLLDRPTILAVDDSPDNLRRAAQVGITAATLEHPWNRDLPDVISAPDWPTLARRLEPHLS